MTDPHLDPVVFARDVLGLEVFEYQAAALLATQPFVVVSGGRRSGKSWAAQIKALHVAMTRRGCRVLVTSAVEPKVRLFLQELVELLRRSPYHRQVDFDARALEVRFRGSGSVIVGVPATAGQLRGYGRDLRLAVADEAAFLPKGTMPDLRFVLMDHLADGAQMLMVSSPWGDREHFFRQSFERGEDGDPDYASFRWRSDMNPRNPKDWIDRERNRLTAAQAAAELDGESPDAFGSFFTRELLDRSTADLELPPVLDLAGEAKPAIGIDVGVTFDRSAVAAICRLPVGQLNSDEPRLPRFVLFTHVWPQNAPLVGPEGVSDQFARMRANCQMISVEPNGAGAAVAQEVQRLLREDRRGRVLWDIKATTAAKKPAGYTALRLLMERGQLVLPRDPDLLRQLAGLKFEMGQQFAKIEAGDAATHDDVADAAMRATGVFQVDGKVRVWLLAHAGERAHGDAFLPPARDAERVVETGGGLRVWQRAPLQSVAGPELTLPQAWGGPVLVEPPPAPVWLRAASGALCHVVPGSEAYANLIASGAQLTEPLEASAA